MEETGWSLTRKQSWSLASEWVQLRKPVLILYKVSNVKQERKTEDRYFIKIDELKKSSDAEKVNKGNRDKQRCNYYQQKANRSGSHKSFQVQSSILNQMICLDLCTCILPHSLHLFPLQQKVTFSSMSKFLTKIILLSNHYC